MKLKYYLRGLGTGIVVTSLLMGVALSGRKEKLSDQEIRQRALEMGMTDDAMVLADMPDEKDEEDLKGPDETVSYNQAEVNDKEEAENMSPEASGEETDSLETEPESVTVDPEGETNHTQGNADGEQDDISEDAFEEGNEKDALEDDIPLEFVVITINSGDGSMTVANKLLQAGIIEDASAFDNFLCRNGYDKRLKTGRHDIPVNALDEEIAAIVTQKGY